MLDHLVANSHAFCQTDLVLMNGEGYTAEWLGVVNPKEVHINIQDDRNHL